jgi:phospholipid/cholesterol/gamma-HCH transport system ATP-binding protein
MSIEFRDLHKSLGGRPILRGVSLHARSNEITFIIGPSGAGKSVTARHAAGLLRPDSGEVVVFGERVHELAETELVALRRRCAFVLQGAALLDGLDLEENVALGARAAGAPRKAALVRARELLAHVGLAGSAGRLPSEVGPGILMRAAVARALALEPQMIIYDEPTSGLDPAAARQIDGLVVRMKREGIGALVISHDLTSIMTIADHIHLLHEGRIYLGGPPSVFQQSADPVVRQFIDGRPEGPLPDW